MLLSEFFLVEDARFDIDFRTHVATMCRSIMDRVYSGAEPFVVRSGEERLFAFEPRQLGLGNVLPTTLVAFGPRKHARHVTGEIIPFKTELRGCNRIIVIHALREFTPEELRSEASSIAVMKVLKHELTHATDFDRTRHRINAKPLPTMDGSDSANIGYYNDNAELNAYYHDVVSDLSELSAEVAACASYEEARDVMELFGLIGDFKSDLLHLLSAGSVTSRAFLRWITADNRKRLLKRIYGLHQEVVQQLNAKPGAIAA